MRIHQALHLVAATTTHGNAAFSALIWWLVPLFAVTGAIVYVIWVARFKDNYQNETNRSVNSFQSFQRSFNEPGRSQGSVRPIAPDSPAPSTTQDVDPA